MMHLKNYLTLNGLDEAVMMSRFGVRVTREGTGVNSLAQFKYSKEGPNWQEPLTHECRGVILRQQDDEGRQWRVVARPWTKFFNYGEGYCPLRPDTNILVPGWYAREKADGSCIMMWWDEALGVWRASTLGSIPTGQVYDNPFTFSELFWKVLDLDRRDCRFDRSKTYMWELCTPHNQIVTNYAHPHVVLLGSIGTPEGEHYAASADPWVCSHPRRREPIEWGISDLGVRNVDEFVSWVEDQSKDPRYGTNPEGFVVYRDGKPVAKFKNERYRQLHAFGGGDIAVSRAKVVGAVFGGTIDDVESALRPELLEYSRAIRTSARELHAEVLVAQARVDATEHPDRKSYALAVQREHQNAQVRSWAFQRGIKGTLDFGEWLSASKGPVSKNYEMFAARWDAVWDTTIQSQVYLVEAAE